MSWKYFHLLKVFSFWKKYYILYLFMEILLIGGKVNGN